MNTRTASRRQFYTNHIMTNNHHLSRRQFLNTYPGRRRRRRYRADHRALLRLRRRRAQQQDPDRPDRLRPHRARHGHAGHPQTRHRPHRRRLRPGLQTAPARPRRSSRALTRRRLGSDNAVAVKTFGDYRELLKDGHVDAVAISTPEHWHCRTGHRRRAGRQRHLRPEAAFDDARRRPRGERHRPRPKARLPDRQPAALDLPSSASPASWSATGASASCTPSRSVCPWTRPAAAPQEMPVPPNLNYEMWLGCTPEGALHRGPRASAEQHHRPARLAAH